LPSTAAKAARVKRGHRPVIHLVGGNLHHFLFEIDRVACGPHAVTSAGGRNTGNVSVLDARQRDVGNATESEQCGFLEFQWRQVASAEPGRIGIGDVLRKHALARLRPFQPGAQHREDRNIGNARWPNPVFVPRPRQPALPLGRLCRPYD
jgi:hypothetical protein